MGKNRPVDITLCYNQLTHSILTFNFVGETSGRKMLPHSWCWDFQSRYFQKEMNIQRPLWHNEGQILLRVLQAHVSAVWQGSKRARVQPAWELPGSSVAMVSAGLTLCSNWRGTELYMAPGKCSYTRRAEIYRWKKERKYLWGIYIHRWVVSLQIISHLAVINHIRYCQPMSTCKWPAHAIHLLWSCTESTSVQCLQLYMLRGERKHHFA